MKPGTPIVLRASFVSQDTSFVLLSVGGRKFLETIVPECARVTRIGKTVLVELDEAERVVRSLAATGDEGTEQSTEDDDEAQPTTAAEVLAAIGKEFS